MLNTREFVPMISKERARLLAPMAVATSFLSACSSIDSGSTASVAPVTNALMSVDASSSAPLPSADDGQGPKSAIAVTVLPNARCRISQQGTASAQTATVNVEQEGVLRFFKPPVSWGSSLSIECSTWSSGARATYTIDLDDPSTFTLDTAYQNPAPVVGARPALSGDPLALTQAQLHAQGYPPRPDPGAEPQRFAEWQRWVSKPLQIVDPVWVADLNRVQFPIC